MAISRRHLLRRLGAAAQLEISRPAVAKRVFEAMMTMKKIDVAAIEEARRG